MPQRMVLEDHHHATIAELVDVARERRCSPTSGRARSISTLGRRASQLLARLPLGSYQIPPSSTV